MNPLLRNLKRVNPRLPQISCPDLCRPCFRGGPLTLSHRLLVFLLTMLVVFSSGSPLLAQQAQTAPWGERIRSYGDSVKEWAGSTTRDLMQKTEGGTCELCGEKKVRGLNKCLPCLKKTAPAEFKQWCDQAWETTKDSVQSLKDSKNVDLVIEKLFEARQKLKSYRSTDSDLVLERNRQWYEHMTRLIMSRDGGAGGRMAREAVRRFAPALEGTDLFEDPARAFSYFWVLDGKGFVKRVRWLRGPTGKFVTLQEYMEQKTGLSPQKSEDIVEILDDVRKISMEETSEMAPAALDALARTLRMLTH